MITANSIKQRSLIASLENFKSEIEKVEELIKSAADQGLYMISFDPEKNGLNRRAEDCSGILNVFKNKGFTVGIKKLETIKAKSIILISWYDDLDKINLLENYEETI